MTGKTDSLMHSKKVRGTLWIIAALPMILVPAFMDGNKGVIAIGLMFMIFGLVSLRQSTLAKNGQ